MDEPIDAKFDTRNDGDVRDPSAGVLKPRHAATLIVVRDRRSQAAPADGPPQPGPGLHGRQVGVPRRPGRSRRLRLAPRPASCRPRPPRAWPWSRATPAPPAWPAPWPWRPCARPSRRPACCWPRKPPSGPAPGPGGRSWPRAPCPTWRRCPSWPGPSPRPIAPAASTPGSSWPPPGLLSLERQPDCGELDEIGWFDFDQARALDLPNITRFVVHEVAQRLADPGRPAPFMRFLRGAWRLSGLRVRPRP
jgi:hypothetical protein